MGNGIIFISEHRVAGMEMTLVSLEWSLAVPSAPMSPWSPPVSHSEPHTKARLPRCPQGAQVSVRTTGVAPASGFASVPPDLRDAAPQDGRGLGGFPTQGEWKDDGSPAPLGAPLAESLGERGVPLGRPLLLTG